MQPPESAVIESILARLLGGDTPGAWKSFLDQYAALIATIVRHHLRDEDDRADAFLFVCEHLCANDCARLRKFEPNGRAHFNTWLTVVVGRLVVDWRRLRHGRERPWANVARLPLLAQRLFHHRFERGLPRAECRQALATEFAGLDDAQFSAALAQVERTLTPEQRWQLTQRRAGTTSLEAAEAVAADDDVENGAAASEHRERLARSMAELDERDRLLLLYRFEQNLSFDAIARLMQLGDPFRARRQVEAALGRLRTLFDPPG